ncbi:uncharacterized protein LOC130744368 [Lotus japonicus]|uniref:uncharacterized protein LOC130744368 n=1 Tax=Lotus japonicus TaxID=34305 RepID=UPI00258670FA|nr:uncharacterized protein LOC130744368 [Lotus japonicus]
MTVSYLQGQRIEATIRKSLIKKLFGEIVEGNIYRITYFAVVPNLGVYKAARHEFKIIFNSRTKIVPEESNLIPLYGFAFMNSAEISDTMGESEHLIDVIGLVTAVSREKQYTKGANITRMIELQLTDHRGSVQCTFFGSYVDVITHYVRENGQAMPVVVIQFAKIKTFKGNVVIQNVMHATRIMWNHEIPEVVDFRNSIALHGIDPDLPLTEIEDDVRVLTIEEEFLTLFPRKKIQEVHETAEAGVFVVYAKIAGLVDGEKWWYSACRCHRSVSVEDGTYYCPGCDSNVLEVTPRFRVKVEVSDGEEDASFVMFDTDCQNVLMKTCKELVIGSKVKSNSELPQVLKTLIGKEFLFKIEKSADHGAKYDDSYKVKKVCADQNVIDLFKDADKVNTPQRSIKVSKFPNLEDGESSNTSPGMGGIYSGNKSEIDAAVKSLEDISPLGSFASPSFVEADDGGASCPKPAKKLKMKCVKIEKE